MTALGIDKTRPRDTRCWRALERPIDAGFWAGACTGAVVWMTTGSFSFGLCAFGVTLSVGFGLGAFGFLRVKRGIAAQKGA